MKVIAICVLAIASLSGCQIQHRTAPSGSPLGGTPAEQSPAPARPRAPNVGEIQEFKITQTLYPGSFDPPVIIAKKDIPVRILITTDLFEHINRVSILPFVKNSDLLEPGKFTVIEFTPDQAGEFKIRNIGHGFEGQLIIQE